MLLDSILLPIEHLSKLESPFLRPLAPLSTVYTATAKSLSRVRLCATP